MPVSVVCDAASVNAALRDSIASSSGAGCSGNQNDDTQSIQSKLVASAKRVLLSKIEYEEVNNYSQSVLDTLKSKYIVLKPSSASTAKSNNGDKDANQSTSATLNNTMAISGQQNGSRDPNQLPQPKRILFPRENVQIGWKSSNRKWQVGAGMMNVGNTCYLNSTLQAIFHVPAMANWLMSDAAHREKCEEENGSQGGCIICAMSKTLIASQTSQSAIRPYLVYSKLRLVCKHLIMGRQEDAHEFLRYLVEAMEKSFLARFRNSKDLEQFSKETTPLNQILGGYLKSAVRCLACGHVSTTYQHFQDLLLDIRKANTIEEALDGYFARERLEDMGYKCEDCKKKVSATKQFSLERAPISLCIQLKRFSMMGTKLNKHVAIRPRLDLTPYASRKNGEKLQYRLVAMVTHLGASQHCGHYTAIGLTDAGGYYQFDDSSVRPISIQNVLNTNAYIIFYELEDPNSQARLGGGLGQGLSTHNEQSRLNGQIQHNDNNSSQQRQNSNLSTNNCNSTVSINTKVINKLDMGSPSTLIGPQLPERSILKTNQNNIDNNYNKNNDVQKPLQNGLATNNNSYSKLVNSPNKTFKSNNDSNHDAPSTSTSNSLQSASQKANITLGNKLVIHFKNNTNNSTSSGFNNGNKFQDSNGTKHQAPNTNKAQTNGYDSSSSVVRCKSTLPSMPKLETTTIKEKSPSTQNGQITLSTASPSKLYVNGHTKNDKVSPVKSLVPYESDDDSNDSNFITTKSDSNNNKHEPNNCIKAESTTVKRSYDISDDSGSDTEAPPRKTKSNPPSPPVVKTKVGLWQVTNADVKPILNSSPSERKNPFATATTTISAGNFYVNSSSKLGGKDKRFNNANNNNRKTDLAGNGETKETVNHLLKYSHRGYGAPVLSWNGHKTDMEKEVIEESRLERKREMQNEEENEMDRGRQKKIKSHQSTTRDNPGYNPFQEYQNQNRRWNNNNNNNNNNGHTQNGRPSFHQNYTYRHHPFHRNQNNFRRHRFHQRPHHQRNGDHGFHHRRES